VLSDSRTLFFIALFYAIWLVSFYLQNTSLELKNFDGRMISSATLYGIDIAARVSVFYKALGILLLSFSVFKAIGFALHKFKSGILYSNEFKIINYVSLAGIVYFLFSVFGFDVSNSIEFVYFLHKWMIGALIIQFFFKNKISISSYTVLLTLACASYFVIADGFMLAGLEQSPDFLMTCFVCSMLLILIFQFKIRNTDIRYQHTFALKMAYIFVPVSFAPFLSVLKDEMFLVLIGKGYQLSSPFFVYVLLLVLLFFVLYLRFIKTSKQNLNLQRLSLQSIIAKCYFPIFIFSLVSYTFYSHFMDGAIEMSEAANKYLPIMEFYKWGIIPGIEKLNSHLLSDYFFGFVYSVFNDFKGNELELYDFLYGSFSALFFYFLIYFITRNAYVSLFTILFYPFFNEILPGEHAFAMLSIVVLFKLLHQPSSLKNYVLFFLGILFLILWRIDVGVACLFSSLVLVSAYVLLGKSNPIDLKTLLKALAIVVIVFSMFILFVCALRHVNIFDKTQYALNYFSSAQTYGYIYIGNTTAQAYIMHYFVYPFVSGLVVLLLIYKFKALSVSKKQRLALLSLFFITAYYFVNFQRGLVRHSLFEGIDVFVSSFICVILAGIVYVFFFKKSQVSKFILLNLILFFAVIAYKVPAVNGSKATFESTIEKIAAYKIPQRQVGDSRIIRCDYKGFDEVIDFFNATLDSTQTFIDFTNTPMLYYFTQRVTPSYFYQNPVCSHNEFLQKRFVDDLKNYQAPYLLFARLIEGENTIDGVQNCFRHYRIAEYLYNNYKPFIIKGDYCIWKKKDVVAETNNHVIYSFSAIRKDSIKQTENYEIRFNPRQNKKYLIYVEATKHLDNAFIFAMSGNEFPPVKITNVTSSETSGYCEIKPKGNSCSIYIKDVLSTIDLKIIECSHIPDFLSERFMTYDLKKLPHIWGTYDKEYLSELVLFEYSKPELLKDNKKASILIPENLDKQSGNSLVITLKNKTDKIQNLQVAIAQNGGMPQAVFLCEVAPSEKEEKYAIRLSSAYNWYKPGINQLILSAAAEANIEITNIKITKAK
jgi:hypothetical protein